MKKIKSFGALLCSVICLLVMACAVIFGQDYAFAVETPNYEIGITPYLNSFETMMPGESYEGTFKVKNTGLQKFDFTISFGPYSIADENYGPDFSKKTVYSDMMDWISVDVEEASLEPNEEREVHYTIAVPSGAHGGAQMASILATMKSNGVDGNNNAVETVRQLAYLVYGNVDGDVIETGKVLENRVPSFLFNPPILATSLVENTGNVYTAAKYTLQVFPLFSDEEVYTNEENPENSIVFPETKRYNEIRWEGAPQLGIFKVRSTVKIFDEESVTEKIVFLCPLWFLFIVILLIFCIIFWIVSRAIRRKREA